MHPAIVVQLDGAYLKERTFIAESRTLVAHPTVVSEQRPGFVVEAVCAKKPLTFESHVITVQLYQILAVVQGQRVQPAMFVH